MNVHVSQGHDGKTSEVVVGVRGLGGWGGEGAEINR